MHTIKLSDRVQGWYCVVDELGNIVADCIVSDREATIIRDALNNA